MDKEINSKMMLRDGEGGQKGEKRFVISKRTWH